jgi:hypothetical protein
MSAAPAAPATIRSVNDDARDTWDFSNGQTEVSLLSPRRLNLAATALLEFWDNGVAWSMRTC